MTSLVKYPQILAGTRVSEIFYCLLFFPFFLSPYFLSLPSSPTPPSPFLSPTFPIIHPLVPPFPTLFLLPHSSPLCSLTLPFVEMSIDSWNLTSYHIAFPIGNRWSTYARSNVSTNFCTKPTGKERCKSFGVCKLTIGDYEFSTREESFNLYWLLLAAKYIPRVVGGL